MPSRVMPSPLALYVVGFGRPDLLREQHRLLGKFLTDPFTLTVVDNTPERQDAARMELTCENLGVEYVKVVSLKHEHHEALNVAYDHAHIEGDDFFGMLDHDVMPYRETSLIDKISYAGFFGLGQTYTPRFGLPRRYLWPGWCFFSRSWLNGRVPNFEGIRGEYKWDDGDTGSQMHTLFSDDDWRMMAPLTHGYGTLRPDDGHGLQSFGFERLDDAWIHFSNASRWKEIPNPNERDMLIRDMLETM